MSKNKKENKIKIKKSLKETLISSSDLAPSSKERRVGLDKLISSSYLESKSELKKTEKRKK